MTDKINLASGWYELQREFVGIFGEDKDVNVSELMEISSTEFEIVLRVSNLTKAKAMCTMLKKEHQFSGNIVVRIVVVDADGKQVEEAIGEDKDLIYEMFVSNPKFYNMAVREIMRRVVYYCIFFEQLIQYPNDDFSSYATYTSKIPSDIVRDLVKETDVIFCVRVDGIEP